MSNLGDDRGDRVSVPPWWLERVNAARERNKKEHTTAWLGIELAKKIGKDKPWNHGTVSNFLNNVVTTMQMAEAFRRLYELPPFVFRAESLEEAVDLQAAARPHQLRRQPNPESPLRVMAVDQHAAALKKAARDQSKPLNSQDERPGRGRRTGRTARRS